MQETAQKCVKMHEIAKKNTHKCKKNYKNAQNNAQK